MTTTATTDPAAPAAAAKGTTVMAPWHSTASVTVHDGKVYVRLGFSEVVLPLADALVFAGDLLEAYGYTYQIHRADDLVGIEPTC